MNKFEDVEVAAVSDGWEAPGQIETKIPNVAVMTPELMPESLRPWLLDISNRMQTPPDFATVSALVVLGSVIGSGCAVKPKQKDDWQVIPNVWGACIGRPSVVLKSPSMAETMRMLDRLQAEYGDQHSQVIADFEADNIFQKAASKDIEDRLSKAAKGKGKTGTIDKDAVVVLKQEYSQMKLAEEESPSRRLFKTNETSVQSMTVLQDQNERGLLVFRDELTALLTRWDKEEYADERAYYLESWNGDGSYTDYKIGRGLTEAKNICISLLGGIQPDKLNRYLYQAMKGNNDGLMQRLQLAVYPDIPKDWKLVDVYPDLSEKTRVYDLIKILAEIEFPQVGAVQGEHDQRPYFRFDTKAQQLFYDWLEHLTKVTILQEDNPVMAEHYGKFRSLMPSLALIFHCIDIADGNTTGDISVTAAQLAIDWCEYLDSHAKRIYSMLETPEHEAAVVLSKKIKSKQLPNPFTAKIVYDKGWHGLKDRDQVEGACNILIEESWVHMEVKPPTGKRGRPASPEYQINPFFL